MILTSVDLPEPFSPTRPCTSPARRSKSTSCSARTPGNDLWMPSARSAGPVLASLKSAAPPPLVVRPELGGVFLRDVDRPQLRHRRHLGLVHVGVHRLALKSHHQRDRGVIGLLERQEDRCLVPRALLDPLHADL